MDLIDRLHQISARIPRLVDHLQTEEATKNALVMPFIQALGYDVFNPLEVLPEFTADVGTKRGEKVDYAILKDDEPVLLVEAKKAGAPLAVEHASQLYRYYSVTKARFALLTNGLRYDFFADLDEDNKMDNAPFFSFDLREIKQADVDRLKLFTKGQFDPAAMIDAAAEIKYTNAIKDYFAQELASPSADFVKLFASQVYQGRMVQSALARFTPLVKRSLNQYISDRISDRLKSALTAEDMSRVEAPAPEPEEKPEEASPVSVDVKPGHKGDGVKTTEAEIEGYRIVKEILHGFIDADRVVMRDTKSYCGILLDDNNRKPICRLYFESLTTKRVTFFEGASREKVKVYVEGPQDLRKHADKLLAIVKVYDASESAS